MNIISAEKDTSNHSFKDDSTLDNIVTVTSNIDLDAIELDLVSFLNTRFLEKDLEKFNITFSHENGNILINKGNKKAYILYDPKNNNHNVDIEDKKNWLNDFKKYKESNYKYEDNFDLIWDNNGFEVPITINSSENKKDIIEKIIKYNFQDSECTINLSRCSNSFKLTFFSSKEYIHHLENYFNIEMFEEYLKNDDSQSKSLALNLLMRNPDLLTVRVNLKNNELDLNSLEKYINKIESCLYLITTNTNDVINLRNIKYINKISKKPTSNFNKNNDTSDFIIPNLKFEPSLISFYKAAYNTSIPSQKFLDFYHIFEFLFLRVSEEVIYDRVKSYVNHSKFRSNPNEIDKLISMVKKHNTENDETEMLKKVLNKYLNEDDVIEFIDKSKLDKDLKNKKIFGEVLNLSCKTGHAISNLATILKHVRNALVHSSDRYKREDCHIPFSESEKLVNLFIPIMDFLAQKVIAGTAVPLE